MQRSVNHDGRSLFTRSKALNRQQSETTVRRRLSEPYTQPLCDMNKNVFKPHYPAAYAVANQNYVAPHRFSVNPIVESGDTIYLFSYKGDSTPQVGVMAQEVEKKDPAAIIEGKDGYKRVQYGRVLARALEAS